MDNDVNSLQRASELHLNEGFPRLQLRDGEAKPRFRAHVTGGHDQTWPDSGGRRVKANYHLIAQHVCWDLQSSVFYTSSATQRNESAAQPTVSSCRSTRALVCRARTSDRVSGNGAPLPLRTETPRIVFIDSLSRPIDHSPTTYRDKMQRQAITPSQEPLIKKLKSSESPYPNFGPAGTHFHRCLTCLTVKERQNRSRTSSTTLRTGSHEKPPSRASPKNFFSQLYRTRSGSQI